MLDPDNTPPAHSFLVRMLPGAWQSKLQERQGVLLVLDNIGWLLIDKAVRLSVGLVVGVWLARYLGTERFGELNYALAVVAIIGTFTGLGLQSVVVRELVTEPKAAPEILGSAGTLMTLAGLGAALICTVLAIADSGGMSSNLLVAILSWMLFFKGADIVRYRFEAKLQSRFVVGIDNAVLVTASAARVILILQRASLMTFVWLILIETAAVAAGLLVLQQVNGGTFHGWKLARERTRQLLRDSWPLMVSGLAVMLYMRIDQIMIGRMINSDQLGIYSAAVRLSEIWYMVPMAITSSALPKIIESKGRSQGQYEHRLMRLFSGLTALSLAAATAIALFSKPIVLLVFGKDYAAAAPVLSLHVWTGIFVSLGVVSSGWFLAENKTTLSLGRALFGALLNVVANLVLIPRLGISGAAWGTLIAQISSAYAFDAIFPATRGLFRMKTRALFTFFMYLRQ